MIIREIDLFEGMSDEVVEELTKVMEMESFETGQVVFSLGDPADYFYILEEGALKLTGAGAGWTTHVAKVPGEAVGWSSVAGRDVYTATVECIEGAKLVKINRQAMDEVLSRHPASGLVLYRRLARLVGDRLIQCYEMLSCLQK